MYGQTDDGDLMVGTMSGGGTLIHWYTGAYPMPGVAHCDTAARGHSTSRSLQQESHDICPNEDFADPLSGNEEKIGTVQVVCESRKEDVTLSKVCTGR